MSKGRHVVAVRTTPWHTVQSLSWCTSSMSGTGRCPRGMLSLTTKTGSWTCRFHLGFSHFWRSCRRGKYSRTHRLHNTFAKHCALRQRLLHLSVPTKTPGGRLELDRSSESLLVGVRGSRSLGSLIFWLKGRSFRILSTSHAMNIRIVSLSTNCSLSIALGICHVERIIPSQTPPVGLADGGLKC